MKPEDRGRIDRLRQWMDSGSPDLLYADNERFLIRIIDDQDELLRRFYADDSELIRIGKEEGVKEGIKTACLAILKVIEQKRREWMQEMQRPSGKTPIGMPIPGGGELPLDRWLGCGSGGMPGFGG